MKLENWYVCGKSICGDVYGNPKFDDGTAIRSSTIQSFGCNSVNTLNSTYRLGVPDRVSEWKALDCFPTEGGQV